MFYTTTFDDDGEPVEFAYYRDKKIMFNWFIRWVDRETHSNGYLAGISAYINTWSGEPWPTVEERHKEQKILDKFFELFYNPTVPLNVVVNFVDSL